MILTRRFSAFILVTAFLLTSCSNLGRAPRENPAAGPGGDFGSAQELHPATDPFIRTAPSDTLTNITPDVWIVELEGAPRAAGGQLSTLDATAQTFLSAAAAAGIDLQLRYRYDQLFNGYSVKLDGHQVGALMNLPGVKRVWPAFTVRVPDIAPALSPQMVYAVTMTGVDVAHQELGLSGEGIRLAVIDTGISLTHPEFAGRIVAGYDFVGDAYDSTFPEVSEPRPEPAPGSRPGGGDCNGHGTHVAGIAAAGGVNVTGVAPEVLLGAYRVFGCEGSTSTDVIISALERALSDGMDIVNLSLGGAFAWPNDPLAVATNNLVEEGVVVVAAIGNAGEYGIYSAGAPGVAEKAIGVASFDNIKLIVDSFLLNGEIQMGYRVIAAAPPPPVDGTTPPLVYVGRGCPEDEYEADPAGRVALITRGACFFDDKYQRAVEAGAVGVIIENNQPGLFSGGGVVPRGPFAIGISQENGQIIKEQIAQGLEPVVTWTAEQFVSDNPTAGLISTFSSYGPAPDLTLKPDIGAPGGLIYAPIFADEENGYAVISGTSMASPHVAGAVALLLEANRRENLGITAEEVRDLLQNTADPAVWWGNPASGFLDAVHHQGAGMLQIHEAVLAQTRVFPGRLSLGEQQGPVQKTFTIENRAGSAVTYTLGNENGVVATYGENPNAPAFALSGAAATFKNQVGETVTTVTVPAGGSASVSVTITPNPTLPDTAVYGGYLTVTPQGENPTAVRVPYMGFKGDYQTLPLFDIGAGVPPPLLVDVVGTSVYQSQPGTTYTMQEDDVPTFAFGLLNYAQVLQAEIVPLREHGWMGELPLVGAALLPRTPPGQVFVSGFGLIDTSMLPDGEYVIRVSALKALGDPTNPAHWVTAYTAPFFIQRAP